MCSLTTGVAWALQLFASHEQSAAFPHSTFQRAVRDLLSTRMVRGYASASSNMATMERAAPWWDESDSAKMRRQCLSEINHLLPHNVERIADAIALLDVRTEEDLEFVVSLVTRICGGASRLFATFCARLEVLLRGHESEFWNAAAFHTALVEVCMKAVERREVAMFMAELYIAGYASDAELRTFLGQLTARLEGACVRDVEDDHESTEVLLQLVGRLLNAGAGHDILRDHIGTLEAILRRGSLPARIRFVLQDTIEALLSLGDVRETK